MVKWLICTLSVLFVIVLSVIGGYAGFFILQQALTGYAILSSTYKMLEMLASILLNAVLLWGMVWAVKDD